MEKGYKETEELLELCRKVFVYSSGGCYLDILLLSNEEIGLGGSFQEFYRNHVYLEDGQVKQGYNFGRHVLENFFVATVIKYKMFMAKYVPFSDMIDDMIMASSSSHLLLHIDETESILRRYFNSARFGSQNLRGILSSMEVKLESKMNVEALFEYNTMYYHRTNWNFRPPREAGVYARLRYPSKKVDYVICDGDLTYPAGSTPTYAIDPAPNTETFFSPVGPLKECPELPRRQRF